MKRYDCVEEDNLIKRDKEFIAQVDEAVRIERAKDRKNYEDALTDMVKEKNEEIARLRKALGWYGNRDNYDWKFIDEWRVKTEKPVIVDGGKRAREALEGK